MGRIKSIRGHENVKAFLEGLPPPPLAAPAPPMPEPWMQPGTLFHPTRENASHYFVPGASAWAPMPGKSPAPAKEAKSEDAKAAIRRSIVKACGFFMSEQNALSIKHLAEAHKALGD